MSGAAQPAAGRYFENRVLEDLQFWGWWTMKSPASKGAVDIVAIRQGRVWFVQCKVNGRLDPEEWNRLVDIADEAGALPIMAKRPKRGLIEYWCLDEHKNGHARQPMSKIDVTELETGRWAGQ